MLFLQSSALSTSSFFFFNDTATTEIYTPSLHDALPISRLSFSDSPFAMRRSPVRSRSRPPNYFALRKRSEEHTSELQSRLHLVCRLLLEKKNNTPTSVMNHHIDYRITTHAQATPFT